MQRRDFLKNSFASVGYAGALTAAMGALGQRAEAGGHMQAGTSVGGDALRGPYLDLLTGRGNQLAYARLLSGRASPPAKSRRCPSSLPTTCGPKTCKTKSSPRCRSAARGIASRPGCRGC